MNRYEAKGFIEETRELLQLASAGELTTKQEDRLLAIEDQAEQLLEEEREQLRIVTNDGSGPSRDPKHIRFNRLEPVDRIEVQNKEKVIEQGNVLVKVTYRVFVAHSAAYEHEGRATADYTQSGPEGFIERKGKLRQFGAASAMTARLLEAFAAGAL